MKVRAVEIVAVRTPPERTGADIVVPFEEASSAVDERGVRTVCARGLAEAAVRGAQSIALPAIGVSETPVISGKILAQEAIRAARSGRSSLRRIYLCCPEERAFPSFEKTVNGYLRHLLDVLIWGPFVTVDAIIELPEGIVLVKRSNPPLGYALPGGFVDYGESLEDAVRRESREETGLELEDLEQFHTYSDPARDPRFHAIATVFGARSRGAPRAGDDAADVRVAPPDEIPGLSFAFDHARVLEDWLARPRSP